MCGNLSKCAYFTGEDLRIEPTVVGKSRYDASPLGTSFSALKKDGAENVAKSESDFNYDSNHKFFSFYRGLNDFKNMSLDPKHNKMKNFKTLLDKFKEVKTKQPDTKAKKERILKNVIKLYNNYRGIHKNDYASEDELSEAKKKKFDYKHFELVDKTDKELKLNEETKKCIEEIKEREKNIDKEGFSRCFNHERSTLVSKLLSQNTSDLKRSLKEVKQQNAELTKDERNSTNEKSRSERFNMILSVIDRICQFFEYQFLPDKQSH